MQSGENGRKKSDRISSSASRDIVANFRKYRSFFRFSISLFPFKEIQVFLSLKKIDSTFNSPFVFLKCPIPLITDSESGLLFFGNHRALLSVSSYLRYDELWYVECKLEEGKNNCHVLT